MTAAFTFDHQLAFVPAEADALLRSVPAAPGVFALRGEAPDGTPSEPYLTRAADLRRRLRRVLAPPEALDAEGRPVLSRRLNLRDRVRTIEWTRTGSEWEAVLVLYRANRAAFGAEAARKRLRLYPPYFLRLTATHEHPRVYTTNRLSRRSLPESFGPFPSRLAAERYADAVLDLFKLRRCFEDLQPHPDHAGCAYGEMKKCMAPCKEACAPEDYAAETAAVLAFLNTRGGSMLGSLAHEREAASEGMDFEAAASLHRQWEKVRGVSLLADELVRPVPQLRALVVQRAAPEAKERGQDPEQEERSSAEATSITVPEAASEEAAVFLLAGGCLGGPERLSTLGVRAVREQTAVGSSLFAQPLMLAAVPLGAPTDPASPGQPVPSQTATALSPEDRARDVLARLEAQLASPDEPEIAELSDTLSLFRRWYYRPEKSRAGEVLLPNPDGSWPVRRLLNAAARTALGTPAEATPVNREALRNLKTKVIHPGREGVERTVPVLPKQTRRRAAEPASASPENTS